MLMVENPTLQVQAVLFNDDAGSLKRAVSAMANAVRVERKKTGILKSVKFVYGDASEKQALTESDVQDLKNEAGELMEFEYRVFGFNTGYGKGNNLLSEKSDSDYLLIMNPDIIVSPRTLIELILPFYDEKTGIVEARQTPIEHPKDYNINTKETEWASGACIMVPAELFEKEKGFDSDTFFMYCEDVDFSWRVRLAGYKIIYQPLAPVYHAKRLSATGNWKPSDKEIYYSVLSALLLAYKWSNDKEQRRLLTQCRLSGSKEYQNAAAEFIRLRETGKLPAQIGADNSVSRFIGGYYTESRFIL